MVLSSSPFPHSTDIHLPPVLFLPFGELTSLRELDILVTTDKPIKLDRALDWLNTSVSRRSATPDSMKSLVIGIMLDVRFVPGSLSLTASLGKDKLMQILQIHRSFWSKAVARRNTWPDLIGLNIYGGSVVARAQGFGLCSLGAFSASDKTSGHSSA
jgi:hypothetical protein